MPISQEDERRQTAKLDDQDHRPFSPFSNDLYARLGASRHMTHEQLKSRNWRAARQFHPDRHHTEGEEKLLASIEAFKQVSEAWRILGDTEKRKIYDETGQYKAVKFQKAPRDAEYRVVHFTQQTWQHFENIFVHGLDKQNSVFLKTFQLQQLQKLSTFINDPGCQTFLLKIIHQRLSIAIDPDVLYAAAFLAAQVPYAPALHHSVMNLVFHFTLSNEQTTTLLERLIYTALSNLHATREFLTLLEQKIFSFFQEWYIQSETHRATIIHVLGAFSQQNHNMRSVLWQEIDRFSNEYLSKLAALTVIFDLPHQKSHAEEIMRTLDILRIHHNESDTIKILIIQKLKNHLSNRVVPQ